MPFSPKELFTPRITFALSFAVLAIGITLFVNHKPSIKIEENKIKLAEKQETLNDLVNSDQDKDGVPDWEEVLWGTNSKKAISNPDGLPDRKWIDDKKTALRSVQKTSPTGDSTQNTTELLSRQVTAILLSLQQNNALTQENITLVAKAVGKSLSSTLPGPAYIFSDMHMSSSTPENRKKYVDSMVPILKKYAAKNLGSELYVLIKAASEQNSKILSDVSKKSEIYRSFGKELMGVEVPRDIAQIHISISNDYASLAVSLDRAVLIFSDPVISLSGIKQYQAVSSDIVNLNSVLGQYFMNANSVIVNTKQ